MQSFTSALLIICNAMTPTSQKFSVSTYPGRHWLDGMGLRTEIKMQYNDGEDGGKDTHADNEYEIFHYR